MGLKTVAEGVETFDQLDRLARRLPLRQGYHFQVPLAGAADLTAFLGSAPRRQRSASPSSAGGGGVAVAPGGAPLVRATSRLSALAGSGRPPPPTLRPARRGSSRSGIAADADDDVEAERRSRVTEVPTSQMDGLGGDGAAGRHRDRGDREGQALGEAPRRRACRRRMGVLDAHVIGRLTTEERAPSAWRRRWMLPTSTAEKEGGSPGRKYAAARGAGSCLVLEELYGTIIRGTVPPAWEGPIAR